MKKIFKYGCLGSIAFLAIGIIVTFIFAPSEEEQEVINKENSTIALGKNYKEAVTFLTSENFISANNNLIEIIKIDSTFSKIDTLRLAIQRQHTSASKTISKEIKTLKAKTYEDFDEFKKITWIRPTSVKGTYGNTVYCYFGIKNDTPTSTRMVIRYYGDEWLFWKKATFLIDGESYPYYPSKTPSRDNNTSVWETTDDVLTESMLQILQKMFTAKNVKYRLEGDKYKDFNLSKSKIKAIQNILKYNYLLSNKDKILNLEIP